MPGDRHIASDPDQIAAALQDVFDASDQGIALFDGNAKLVQVNACFRALHPTLNDLLTPGLDWGIFLNEAAQRGVITRQTSQALDALEAQLDLQGEVSGPLDVEAPDGTHYRFKLTPTAGNGFALTQAETLNANAVDDALREAETVLRKVLEACPVSLTMSRINDGQVIYRSPAATQLLGMSKSSFAHFARVEDRADYVTALLSDGQVDNMRTMGVNAQGAEFPGELSARLIEYRGEDVIVTNIEDISRELEVQIELDRQKEKLFQSEKLSALGELLAGVAHELNNPLSIIVGNAEMLEEELAGSRLSTRVSKLSTAAHRCIRIVRSFLALARQEPLELRAVSIDQIVRKAKEALIEDMGHTGVSIGIEDLDRCPSIWADEVQLTQVIINLLMNAIHAMSEAGVGDKITLSARVEHSKLHLRVCDNGPGVPDSIKSRIFDPLFTTKKGGKGTGVGLAFCHRILAGHNGAISLEKGSAKGATFVLEIPLQEA
ncbi:MAG: ATP-binding protein [Pseudomonadota bacterium]